MSLHTTNVRLHQIVLQDKVGRRMSYTLPTYRDKPHQPLSNLHFEELLLHLGDYSIPNLFHSGHYNQVQPSNNLLDSNLLHTMMHFVQLRNRFLHAKMSLPHHILQCMRIFAKRMNYIQTCPHCHRNHWHIL